MASLYSDIQTWLHRWPAGLKLLLLVVFSVALLATQHPLWLMASALLCLLLWFSLGQATQVVRRLMRALIFAALLVAGFHLFMGNAQLAWTSSVRLLCASTLGLALTLSTRSSDLVDVLSGLLAPLRHVGVPHQRLALQLALMLRFTEHFFQQWSRLNDAHRLRTGRSGGLRLIAPLTILMLQTSRRVADALWARLGA